jgi:hypothetical protein
MAEDTAIAKVENPTNALMVDRPAFLPQSHEGTEHIGKDDIKLPSLRIAQGLSKQVQRNDPRFIQGLSVGQLFNDLTNEIYPDALEFHIVRADPPRFIEFHPREEGGGVKDMNVPAGDPRTKWGVDEHGNSVKPVATMFYDYVICLWPTKELIVLSLKSSGIKVAKSLNGLIKLRNAPLWAGRYIVRTADEPSPNGPFPNYVIKNAGWVRTEEDAAFLKHMFDSLQGKTIDIEREPGDDTDFPPVPAPAAAGADDIPY